MTNFQLKRRYKVLEDIVIALLYFNFELLLHISFKHEQYTSSNEEMKRNLFKLFIFDELISYTKVKCFRCGR